MRRETAVDSKRQNNESVGLNLGYDPVISAMRFLVCLFLTHEITLFSIAIFSAFACTWYTLTAWKDATHCWVTLNMTIDLHSNRRTGCVDRGDTRDSAAARLRLSVYRQLPMPYKEKLKLFLWQSNDAPRNVALWRKMADFTTDCVLPVAAWGIS